MDWLYGARLDIDKLSLEHFYACYKFADQRRMIDFKNKIVDAIRAQYKKNTTYIHPYWLLHVHQKGLQGSRLHEFFLKSFVRGMFINQASYIDGGNLEDDLKFCLRDRNLSFEILQETLRYHRSPWFDPNSLEGCHYHDHSDGSFCGNKNKEKK